MNMENKNLANQYSIPVELFADILRILLKSKIPYQITGVKSRTNNILLKVLYPQDKSMAKAKENIETILDDFGHYMSGLSDAVIYSEENE